MRIGIYGTGAAADFFIRNVYPVIKETGIEIAYAVDDREDRYNGFFHGLRIRSLREVLREDDGVICVYFESTIGINMYQARDGIDKSDQDRLISEGELYEVLLKKGFLKGKKILFFGDREMYEALARNHLEMLSASDYLKEGTEISKDAEYDYCFLCAPWYSSNKQVNAAEKRMKKDLLNSGYFSNESIISSRIWRKFLTMGNYRIAPKGDRNPDKTFLVYRPTRYIGLSTIILNYLSFLSYADRMGYFPVADLQNYRNAYLSEDKYGKENPWEWLFYQKDGITLDEVYSSRSVILYPTYPEYPYSVSVDRLLWKKEILEMTDKEYKRLFPGDTDRVLGVVYRGTDYNVASMVQKPLSIGRFIKRVKEYIIKYDYDYVFLATEVDEAVDVFKKAFGNRLFCTDQQRFHSSERRILASVHFDRDNDEYKKAMEYLTVLMLLTKCKAIVGSKCTAVQYACAFNPRMEHVEYFSDHNNIPRFIYDKLENDLPRLLRKMRRIMKIGEYSRKCFD